MGGQLGSARRRPSKRVSNNSNKPLGLPAAGLKTGASMQGGQGGEAPPCLD